MDNTLTSNAGGGAVPRWLSDLLDLPSEAREVDVISRILALQRFSAERLEKRLRELVEAAIRPGSGELEGKLRPDEREFALRLAREDLPTFVAFLRSRPHLAQTARLASVDGTPAAAIDETQRSINRQVGLSDEQFRRWNR